MVRIRGHCRCLVSIPLQPRFTLAVVFSSLTLHRRAAILTTSLVQASVAAAAAAAADVDLFGEETEEEKKAAEELAAAVKASAKKKESGKSSMVMDIKPWDDETDMKKLEEAVTKLAPVGYGIKKLQIMLTIVDDLVHVDSLIEDHLLVELINEYVQSCDIVVFNKI
ncbi:hypothetical protein Ancab_024241 [Ancistrocladus abbreviatus]